MKKRAILMTIAALLTFGVVAGSSGHFLDSVSVLKAESKSVTYTVKSKSQVTTSGTAPTNSSATYSSTYGTACQLTKDNSMTLTLDGFAGYKITSIVMSMKSNKSGGSGTFALNAGSTTLSEISPSAQFQNSKWHGSWSTSYVDVTPTMINDNYEIKSGEKVEAIVSASENSLYCQSFTFVYEIVESSTDNSSSTSSKEPVNVSSVSLNKNSITLEVDETEKLLPTVFPENADNKSVTWESSNTAVATVANDGTVKGISQGTATITVKTVDGNKTATCTVEVTAPNWTDTLNLNGTSKYISSGLYYMKLPTGDTAPTAVTAGNGPSLLTFYLVGSDKYKIGDASAGNYLYLNGDSSNNNLRYGNGTVNIWNISADGAGNFTFFNEKYSRYLRMQGTADFRSYKQTTQGISGSPVTLSDNISEEEVTVTILGEDYLELEIGKTLNLRAEFTNGYDITWSSSIPAKASVSKNADNSCTVTGIMPGEVIITADVSGIKDTVTINVLSNEEPDELEGDILNSDVTKNTASSYTSWILDANTNSFMNSYKGFAAGSDNTIQLKSNDSNSGIISTDSGKIIRKVIIRWSTKTTAGRRLSIYGSNEPYESISDLYGQNKGTILGEFYFSNGEPTSIEITEDYEYIGVRSNSGALYLEAISFVWDYKPLTQEQEQAVETVETMFTSYSLRYKYEHNEQTGAYTFSDIALRFGGLIEKNLWNTIKNNVGEFGVIAVNKNKYSKEGYKTLEEGITEMLEESSMEEAVELCGATYVTSAGSEPSDIKQNNTDYVIFNAVAEVPSIKYIDTELICLAYLKVNGEYVFMNERTWSVRSIAREYMSKDEQSGEYKYPDVVASEGDSLQALIDWVNE